MQRGAQLPVYKPQSLRDELMSSHVLHEPISFRTRRLNNQRLVCLFNFRYSSSEDVYKHKNQIC